MEPIRGYCIVCKTTREVNEPKQIDRAGGPAVEGRCAVCGGKMFVLGASVSAPASEPPD